MITSFLELSNSPTQQKESKKNCAFFKGQIMDNDGNMFDVDVEYQWTPYYGLGHEKSVWDFDYRVNGTPNISKQDECQEVKDLIRENAGCTVSFY